MLMTALIAAAAFLLGLRAGLAIGYRAERGRRIVAERKWLLELGRVLGIRPVQLDSVEATRTRILDQMRDRAIVEEREAERAALAERAERPVSDPS